MRVAINPNIAFAFCRVAFLELHGRAGGYVFVIFKIDLVGFDAGNIQRQPHAQIGFRGLPESGDRACDHKYEHIDQNVRFGFHFIFSYRLLSLNLPFYKDF